MEKLERKDLFSLEKYAEIRTEFRAGVLEHKKHRVVRIGDHAALYFEDRLTVQYQVQEMLRIEKIFEADQIQEELDAYNPLIPDGSNLKATFMLEYPDVDDRKRALAELIGVEDKVWIGVDGYERVYAVADEDLERENDEKTSSVHFLRFELPGAVCDAIRKGQRYGFGIEHPAYEMEVYPAMELTGRALAADLD